MDGAVHRGKALVSQRALTGESQPIERRSGDRISRRRWWSGASQNQCGADRRANARGSNCGGAAQCADQGHSDRGLRGSIRRRPGDSHIPIGRRSPGLDSKHLRALSILIIDFGTGVRVAAPTVILSTMTRAARESVLIKGGRSIEKLADVDTIVFDKTGTLTSGKTEVVEVIPLGRRTRTGSFASQPRRKPG